MTAFWYVDGHCV